MEEKPENGSAHSSLCVHRLAHSRSHNALQIWARTAVERSGKLAVNGSAAKQSNKTEHAREAIAQLRHVCSSPQCCTPLPSIGSGIYREEDIDLGTQNPYNFDQLYMN